MCKPQILYNRKCCNVQEGAAEFNGTNIQVAGASYVEDITDMMHLINCGVTKKYGRVEVHLLILAKLL
jgi:hypothetical protein